MNRPRPRRKSSRSPLAPYLWSLIPGLGLPMAFTFMYATTLNFAPLYVWLFTLNFTLFALMGKDKLAAQKGWPRTPEFTLLLLAFFGATPALLISRFLFNHKTSKQSFIYAMVGTIALQGLCIWYFWPQLQPWL